MLTQPKYVSNGRVHEANAREGVCSPCFEEAASKGINLARPHPFAEGVYAV